MSESSDKICPFMSSADKPVLCNSRCKLYKNKKNFECSFQEIGAISWNTRKPGQGDNSFRPIGPQ